MVDKSKTYIAMADCPEIQDGWKPQFGDYIKSPQGVIEIITKAKELPSSMVKSKPEYLLCSTLGRGGECTWTGHKDLRGFVFLPRQHQYQDMCQDSYDFVRLSRNFANFVQRHKFTGTLPIPFKFTSMEQLWCAFYMKEKHNKTWDGEKWIKKPKR